jgi:hypothetical protein
MSGAEYAIAGTIVSSAFSLGALIVSRIRCRTVRDDDGTPHCLSACSDRPLLSDDLHVDEYTVGDSHILLLSSSSAKK